MEKNRVHWKIRVGQAFAILTLLLSLGLILGLGSISAQPAQQTGCTPIYKCDSCSLSFCCEVTGYDCSGQQTPGAAVTPGTPVPVTPRPTATPFPPQSVDMCVADSCAEGETRLALVHYRCMAGSGHCYPHSTEYVEGCCGPSCPCGETTDELQPCTPGGSTTCSEYGATVCASLPVFYAGRQPFPRTMVTLAEHFWLSDANGNPIQDMPTNVVWSSKVNPSGDAACSCREDGDCDDDSPPVGTKCDFQIGLKAEPGNEPPTWSCEDAQGGTGYRVSCMWEHSSAGKEYNGFGKDCEDLPAFSVGATAPYWWSIGRQWYQWAQIGRDCDCVCATGTATDQCDCHGSDGSRCTGANEFCKQECDPIYGWKHEGPNWELLDLRDYGHPTPYMLNPRVQLAPSYDCGPHPTGVIYVPVIEVQGVISNPKD